jgi:hypothetical protein
MTEPDDIGRALEPEIGGPERERLLRLAERLENQRPVPRAAFRGELRRHLLSAGGAPHGAAPARLRLLIASYLGSGLILLAVAALGVAGAGPFSA